MKKQKQNVVSIKCSEYETGGEVCKGDEDSSWPSYEPREIDVSVLGIYAGDEVSLTNYQVDVSFDPEEYIGKPVYLVFVRYTTGDTFGCSIGNPHFAGCYIDEEKAIDIEKQINNNTYGGDKPWNGYFESLDSVEVVTEILRKK